MGSPDRAAPAASVLPSTTAWQPDHSLTRGQHVNPIHGATLHKLRDRALPVAARGPVAAAGHEMCAIPERTKGGKVNTAADIATAVNRLALGILAFLIVNGIIASLIILNDPSIDEDPVATVDPANTPEVIIPADRR